METDAYMMQQYAVYILLQLADYLNINVQRIHNPPGGGYAGRKQDNMKDYNVKLKRHRRTSIIIDSESDVGFPVMITSKNKDEAKEIAKTMVSDYYIADGMTFDNAAYMAKQYTYIVEPNE